MYQLTYFDYLTQHLTVIKFFHTCASAFHLSSIADLRSAAGALYPSVLPKQEHVLWDMSVRYQLQRIVSVGC